jgi:hypothetical protein
MRHWAAMKKQASSKLEEYKELTEEQQQRCELLAIQWRDMVDASDEVMSNFNKANQSQESEVFKG